MEKDPAPRSYGAVTAIAAVLVLSATSALAPAQAQDMTSGTTLPTQPGSAPVPGTVVVPALPSAVPPAPAPIAPQVVLPDFSPAPAVAAPEAATPGAASGASNAAPLLAAPAEAASSTAPARAVARSAPEPTRVPTAADAGAARDGALARGDAPPPVAAPPRDGSSASPSAAALAAPAASAPAGNGPARNEGLPVEGVLGLLAALGVAGAGIAAMMMRRRKPEPEADSYSEPWAATSVDDRAYVQPLEPAAEARPAEAAVPIATAAVIPPPTGPSADAMAEGPVPLQQDRRALLEAMVDAPPDAANPFTSRKGRMRRARLILQRREHAQTEGKPFDWRTYKPTTTPAAPAIAGRKEPVEV